MYSSALTRMPIAMPGPIAARTAAITASGKRRRLASEPPNSSSRRFEAGDMNCCSRWPCPAVTSIPSKPASRRCSALRTWPSTTASISPRVMAWGICAVGLQRTAEAPQDTVRSHSPSIWRPRWMTWPKMRAPSSCTARAIRAKGATQRGS